MVLNVLIEGNLGNLIREVRKMRTLTKKEMLEIKGAGWVDVVKGSLWSAGIGLAILVLWRSLLFCQLILSGWRNRPTSGNSARCNRQNPQN